MPQEKPFKILFVCTGNICRSPLAQAAFEHLLREEGLSNRFRVDSAGTDEWEVGKQADPRMRRVAAAHGIEIDHVARQLTVADIAEYDLLLAMDKSNYHNMRSLAGALAGKIKLYREYDPKGGASAEVPDPYYGGAEGFEHVYRIVERTSRELLSSLTRELAASR